MGHPERADPALVPKAFGVTGIRLERWFIGWPKSPRNPELVDNWSTYEYVVPGIFIMENRSYPHCYAEAHGYAPPSEKPATYRVEQQAVTPISET
jgi:hypothetical protein